MAALITAGWVYIWGGCLSPLNTACFATPGGHGDLFATYYSWFLYARSSIPSIVPPVINSTSWPGGAAIAYLDPITLAAIVFRPIQRLTTVDFQYFTLVSYVNLMATGLMGYWIGRQRSGSHLAGMSLGAILAFSGPVLYRYGFHPAMTCHGLLVACFFLLISRDRSLLKWALILMLSLGTSAYLFAMIFPYALLRLCTPEIAPSPVAMQLCRWIGPGASPRWHAFRARLVDAAALLLAIAASIYCFGFFAIPTEAAPAWGQQSWSANLLTLIDSANQSRLVPPLPRVLPLQQEGFAYLGLFCLGSLVALSVQRVLGIVAGPSGRERSQVALFPSTRLFWLITIGFLIFSFGQQWYLGTTPVVDLRPLIRSVGPLASIFSMFRTTGRFIWVPYYVILISVTCAVWRIPSLWSRRRRIVFEIGLLLLLGFGLYEHQFLALANASAMLKGRYDNAISYRPTLARELQKEFSRPGLIFLNLTGDPYFKTPLLDANELRWLNPTLRTNYRPYFSKYPNSLFTDYSGDPCRDLQRIRAGHPDIDSGTLVVAHERKLDSCDLPGLAIRRLISPEPGLVLAKVVADGQQSTP